MSCPSSYITQNPKKVATIEHTNATLLNMFLSPWLEDGSLGGIVVVVGAGGLLMALGWGADPFGGDNCGDIIGTCDGFGGFITGTRSWTEITIFWPRLQ